MRQTLRATTLVPRGFSVVDTTDDAAGTLVTVRAVAEASTCPSCGSPSKRVHSRYRGSVRFRARSSWAA